MKYYLSIILVSLSIFVQAQDVKIMEDQANYDESSYTAFSIYLEPGTKAVKKELKDYMDDQHDVRMKGIGFLTNKDVLYAKGVNIESISNKKMDFYAKVVEEGDRTKLSFFGAYGYDVTIDPTVDYQAYNNLRKTMIGFVNDYLPGYYTEQIEDAQEVVEDLKDDTADLKDDIADNKEDIKEKFAEIEDLRKENKDLTDELKETSQKLMTREQELNDAKLELERINAQIKGLKGN